MKILILRNLTSVKHLFFFVNFISHCRIIVLLINTIIFLYRPRGVQGRQINTFHISISYVILGRHNSIPTTWFFFSNTSCSWAVNFTVDLVTLRSCHSPHKFTSPIQPHYSIPALNTFVFYCAVIFELKITYIKYTITFTKRSKIKCITDSDCTSRRMNNKIVRQC